MLNMLNMGCVHFSVVWAFSYFHIVYIGLKEMVTWEWKSYFLHETFKLLSSDWTHRSCLCIACVFQPPHTSSSLHSAQTCHKANTGPTRLMTVLIQHLSWCHLIELIVITCWFLTLPIGIAGIYLELSPTCNGDFFFFFFFFIMTGRWQLKISTLHRLYL